MTHHQGLLVPEHDHHRMAIAVRTLLAPEEIRAAARALTARSSTFGREHPLRTLKALFQSGRLRYRRDVLQALNCAKQGNKDSLVRQACIELHGGDPKVARGTKKAPGRLYGVSSHAWQALGLVMAHRLTMQHKG